MVTRLLLLAVVYFYGIAAQYNQKYSFSQYSLSVTQQVTPTLTETTTAIYNSSLALNRILTTTVETVGGIPVLYIEGYLLHNTANTSNCYLWQVSNGYIVPAMYNANYQSGGETIVPARTGISIDISQALSQLQVYENGINILSSLLVQSGTVNAGVRFSTNTSELTKTTFSAVSTVQWQCWFVIGQTRVSVAWNASDNTYNQVLSSVYYLPPTMAFLYYDQQQGIFSMISAFNKSLLNQTLISSNNAQLSTFEQVTNYILARNCVQTLSASALQEQIGKLQYDMTIVKNMAMLESQVESNLADMSYDENNTITNIYQQGTVSTYSLRFVIFACAFACLVLFYWVVIKILNCIKARDLCIDLHSKQQQQEVENKEVTDKNEEIINVERFEIVQ